MREENIGFSTIKGTGGGGNLYWDVNSGEGLNEVQQEKMDDLSDERWVYQVWWYVYFSSDLTVVSITIPIWSFIKILVYWCIVLIIIFIFTRSIR